MTHTSSRETDGKTTHSPNKMPRIKNASEQLRRTQPGGISAEGPSQHNNKRGLVGLPVSIRVRPTILPSCISIACTADGRIILSSYYSAMTIIKRRIAENASSGVGHMTCQAITNRGDAGCACKGRTKSRDPDLICARPHFSTCLDNLQKAPHGDAL
jgi:hypothetical protein